MSNAVYDFIIVGAGAAGMIAAISANSLGIKALLIEGNESIGKKILSTGNGKCNLSHRNINEEDYSGTGREYIGAFLNQFGTEDTISFFESLGMMIRDKEDYLYPYSEQALTVLETLKYKINSSQIRCEFNCKINSIKRNNKDIFELVAKDGRVFEAKKILLCTGGYAAPKSGSDGTGIEIARTLGLKIIDCNPALVKVKSKSDVCKAFDGVRAKGKINLYIGDELSDITDMGEIQFTKDGLSGIPVFNVSRTISYALTQNKKVEIKLDLLPDISSDSLVEFLENKIASYPINTTPEIIFNGLINKKLSQQIIKQMGLIAEKKMTISREMVIDYVSRVKACCFDIVGVYGFDFAQVCAGGVSFSEINEELEAKSIPGLYLAGEILDIDGKCGGYNLQWAWTSGYLAGRNAAKALNK